MQRINFKFYVTPSKDSNKPIMWSPKEQDHINDINCPNKFQIQHISQEAVLPQRATIDSTGYDIAACTTTSIPPNTTATIPLGSKMSFLSHLKCNLRPQSSLSLKGINVALGTIDPDYRGEFNAIVTNSTDTPFDIHYGQCIGQLVFSQLHIRYLKQCHTSISPNKESIALAALALANYPKPNAKQFIVHFTQFSSPSLSYHQNAVHDDVYN